MKALRTIGYVLTVLMMLASAGACSTTRRVPQDDHLYTGIKKIEYSPDTVKIPGELSDAISETAFTRPNNYWSFIAARSPFPVGLWVYNNWDPESAGLKHWLYEKLVEEPVLISDVRPEVRVKMMEETMQNNGYFRGKANYELIPGKNPRKAKVKYTIHPGSPFPIDTLMLLPDTTALNVKIDSLAMTDSYLSQHRPVYNTDSLSAARIRITNSLRNMGYYYFEPDFIEYLADSVEHRGQIAMKLSLNSSVPPFALRSFKTGHVTVHLLRSTGGGDPDTVQMQRATLIQMMPSNFRRSLIDQNVTFRPGRTFSVRNMNRTQTCLSRLGIFSSINMEVHPDTLAQEGEDRLDVDITATFDAPLEASIEVNASSKSNSYIGPGVTLGVTNKNIFGGGEQLSVKLTGAYEWQTGHGSDRSLFNSYEFGLSGSLAFPRLLAPKFVPRSRFQLNWTRFQLGADLLNRPHYFKMAQFNASINYDWRFRRHVQNSLTLFKLTYTNMMHTTAEFDSIMAANPAVAQSFMSQFIPQMSYSYVYDRTFGTDNTLNWQFTISEAGNVFWGLYEACGKHGEKKLFGTPFSQFVKGQCQLVWGRRIGRGDSWLMTRVVAGAAHAYGNSSQVPYAEQFYVGGANSVRAFAVRSVGPGRYKAAPGQSEDYFDRTGTFKFEANVEYRFPIAGIIHGALFLDAGNVWLLEDDPMRPGATLQAKSFFKDLAVGTGLGIRVDVSMLVVRGDLGIGIHAPYDTGKSGYYNMTSFGNSLAFHLAIGYPF